ncbi:DNA adenine methylase [Sphaerochaeta sp. PS]|uniref:DNA adenine methylase n=1 Tax=Sphaerochaeta sp. PS TaxID=3076336 RepID=UPI0028A3609B|nr:DNA adenine methylase [Sphaerochaeta sp. PS]MDT4761851.1 DNA adenine methylase [Sphaerochaeta sp. PS]
MASFLSPLRYPGGKSALYHKILPIVERNAFNGIYIEPFAGGSGLALKLLFNKQVSKIILNDFDYHIYCFWKSCIDHTEEFIELIEACEVCIDTRNIQKIYYKNPSQYSILEVGFSTFFLNRTNVSGIIQGGPIGGADQTGKYKINARFNKSTLIDRIKLIGDQKNNIEIFNQDASVFLSKTIYNYDTENTLLNIDPPYVKKGALLYENYYSESDHVELSNVIRTLTYKWVLTYDDCELINDLYQEYSKIQIQLNYRAGTKKAGNELLIFSNHISQP